MIAKNNLAVITGTVVAVSVGMSIMYLLDDVLGVVRLPLQASLMLLKGTLLMSLVASLLALRLVLSESTRRARAYLLVTSVQLLCWMALVALLVQSQI